MVNFSTILTLIAVPYAVNSFSTLGSVCREGGSVRMSALTEGRREYIKHASVALLGLTAFSQTAHAAKYFGDKNAYPEVLKPENAVRVDEAFGSSETKSAVSVIKAYQKAVVDLQTALAKNEQVDLRSQIKSTFDLSKLRNSLNVVSASFEEDSQRGLDRVTRLILQDAIELEEASKLKPGVPRNQRRLTIMNNKLTKLSAAFEEMLRFL